MFDPDRIKNDTGIDLVHDVTFLGLDGETLVASWVNLAQTAMLTTDTRLDGRIRPNRIHFFTVLTELLHFFVSVW